MSSPATRARTRQPVAQPGMVSVPHTIRPTTTPRDIVLVVAGRSVPIGDRIEGATPWEATTDSAAAVTLPVRDTDGVVLGALTTPELTLDQGATVTLDGVAYALADVDTDETLVVLHLEDMAAYRLRAYTSPRSWTRGQVTRAGAVREMCLETGRGAAEQIRWWIPEHRDVQPIAKAAP